MLDRQIRSWELRNDSVITSIVTLARKDGRQTLGPRLLHFGEDRKLVIDHDVTGSRVEARDVVQHALLVNIDQDASFDGIP